MTEGNDGCRVIRTYYGRAQGKKVKSLVVVKCNFVGAYVKPPGPIVSPELDGWTDESGAAWLDENNNQWEA